MLVIFYLLSSFPALAFNFGFGNVPVRYLAIPLGVASPRFYRNDILFVLAAIIHIIYSCSFFFVRPFSGLDLSYFLAYLYVFVGIAFVRSNLVYFKRFVYLFWVLNVSYAALQQILLMLGVGHDLSLIHQNTHHSSYVIPVQDLFPFFFRVTGLFVESAPFVIYLVFTHFAFLIFGSGSFVRFLNLAFIFFAGAKVGYVFLILYVLSIFCSRLRYNIGVFLLVACLLSVFLTPLVLNYISGIDFFWSISLRLLWLHNLFYDFYVNYFGLFFGNGFVSSTELMAGDYEGAVRGIDFFSTYIYSNGIAGSFFLLSPIILWFSRAGSLMALRDKNIFYICLALAFITMGSLLNFQYAYLVFLLAYSSQVRTLAVDA